MEAWSAEPLGLYSPLEAKPLICEKGENEVKVKNCLMISQVTSDALVQD